MHPLLPSALLLTASLLVGAAGADAEGEYLLFSPWSPYDPDCHVAPPDMEFGLGGACFAVPADAATFRVTLEDDVFGPGYGILHLCEGGACVGTPICGGVAEGDVPEGTTHATVTTFYALSPGFCGPEALTWTPTHGTITLTFSAQ